MTTKTDFEKQAKQALTAVSGMAVWFYGLSLTERRKAIDYEARVMAYEAEGMTRSDAQGCVDAEMMTAGGES